MVVLQVKVKPSSRKSSLELLEDGTWLAKLKSPPVDGRANAELIALLAEHFHVARARIAIKHGLAGRLKRVHIVD